MQQQKQNVSSEPYGTGKSEEDDINEDSFASMAFYILVGIAEAIGLISIAMVVIWMKHYRGGFAWDGSGKEFNYHPVFMVLALVFLNGNGNSNVILLCFNQAGAVREDSQIDFSRETSFGRFFETPPSEKRQYLKIPENRFFPNREQ